MKSARSKPVYRRIELLVCAARGHETYQPTGSKAALSLAKKLCVNTSHGPAWLCLRCASYEPGAPKFSGPLTRAPIVMRGKLLRQAVILRVLAVERIIRGLLLIVLAYAIFKFKSNQGSLTHVLEQALPSLHSMANSIGYDLDSSETLKLIREALSLGQHTLTLAAIGALVYAAIEIIEGVGLWLMKRWGEYFAVVATSLFIPLEIYELLHHTTFLKAAAFAVNVAAVVYLLYSKRLFGLRGGKAAFEADLAGTNLLEIVRSSR